MASRFIPAYPWKERTTLKRLARAQKSLAEAWLRQQGSNDLCVRDREKDEAEINARLLQWFGARSEERGVIMESKEILTPPMRRLVPGEEETAEDVAGIANDQDWLMVRVIEARGDEPAEDIYATENGRTTIHWIQDPKINVSYIAIVGENLDEVAELIRSRMKIHGLGEIRRMAMSARSRADRLRSIYYLALTASTEYDPGTFQIFCSCLEDADPEVRGAAVLAISYVGWREFLEPLRKRVAEDGDLSVVEDATVMIRNLQKYPARSVISR